MPCMSQIPDFYNLHVTASNLVEIISCRINIIRKHAHFVAEEELRSEAQENSSHLTHISMTSCSNTLCEVKALG